MARGKASGRYTPSRRGRGDDGDASARWLTTYGDAVTLLMAFFVMLYAMSQIDVGKFEAFVQGLEAPFGNAAVRDGLLDAQSSIVPEAHDPAPPQVRPEPVRLAEHAEPRPDAPADPRDLEQLEEVRRAVAASLEAAGVEQLADWRMSERGLVVSITTDDVLFETGSTRIAPLGRRIIAAVAGPLQRFGNDVLVEGHTDDVPLDRAGYTNWNLSTDRAVAVLTVLYADHGIAQQRLGAVGYGEFRPRVANADPESRALNRRVDVLIVAQGA